MPAANGFIPQSDPYTIPKGLTETRTPQGGTSYTDTSGTYGAQGAVYIKGANGYTLAPQTLEGNQTNLQSNTATAGQVNSPTPQVQVQPAGTTVKTAPTVASPTTTTPATPSAMVDPTSPQAQALSKALEDAANSGGNNLNAVPVKGQASNGLDATGNPLPSADNFSLADVLQKIGTAPAVPDANATMTAAQNSLGIPALQQNIQTMTQQLTDLENNLQNQQAQEASKPGVVATIVNGRMQMLSAQQSKALNDLKSQISEATTQLNNANTAVQAIIKNTQTDYANAQKQYEDLFTQAMAIYNDEQNQQNKAQASAQANIKVILDSYKGSSTPIDPTLSAQFGSLEAQAGYPTGTMQALIKAQSDTGGKFGSPIKNATTGEVYAPYTSPDGKTMTMVKIGNIGSDTAGTGTANGILAGTTGSPTINTLAPGYTSVPVAGGLSQAAVDQAALEFAMTGTMPSMGLGSTGAAGARRVAIQNRAAELNAGGNIQANKATLQANSKSLAQQVAYLNTTQRSLTNAENGMQQLLTAFKGKVNDQSMPIANVLANAAKYNLGSSDVNAYKAALAEVANEYTQVFSRGGQVSDAVRSRANDVINGDISISDLQKVSDGLQAQGAIVIQGAQSQVQSIQGQINGIIGGGTGTSSLPNPTDIQNDITNAIKDTKNFPNREALIPAIAQEYGISTDQAANYVYQYWTDNARK